MSSIALCGALPIMLPVQTVFLSKVTVMDGKRLSKHEQQPVKTIFQFIWSTGNWVFENAAKEYALVSNQRASWLSGSQVPQPTCYWTFMAVGEPDYPKGREEPLCD